MKGTKNKFTPAIRLFFVSCITFAIPTLTNATDIINNGEVYFSDIKLNSNCDQTYSIINRNCSGTDGDAYKTIQDGVNALRPSDTLYIREGVYREQVTVEIPGALETSEITISAYTDEYVEINSADNISNWIRCQSQSDCEGNPNWANIYYTSPGFEINQLFQLSQKLDMSRYPNQGWEYPISVGSDPQIEFTAASTVSKKSYFNEAIANIKTTPYWHSNIPVGQSYANGKIVLEQKISSYKGPISTNFGYYFTNIVEEINDKGEWAYSNISKKLYLWPNNNLQNIEASKRSYGILIVNTNHAHINNISIKYPRYSGVWILGSDHNKISNMEIDYSYKFGIKVQGGFSESGVASFNHLDNNTVKYANYRGITNDSATDNISITGNYIYATGAENLGDDIILGTGVGIFVEGTNAKVINNIIDRTGYNSIHIGGSQRSNKEIAFNHTSNSNLALTDGAAIYASGKSTSGKFDHIHHNILQDIRGYLGGIKRFSHCDISPDPETCSDSSQGIYIDEQGDNFRINDNTVINSKYSGIYLHWTKNIVVSDNILYNNKYQIWLSGNINSQQYVLENINISNNILFSTKPSQSSFFLGVNYNDFGFGLSKANYFLNPYNPNNIRSLRYVPVPFEDYEKVIDERISLSDWKNLSGKEAGSMDMPDNYLTKNAYNFKQNDSFILTNPSMNKKEFQLTESYCDIEGNTVSNSIELSAFHSIILLRCFCNSDNICNNNEDILSCSEDCS